MPRISETIARLKSLKSAAMPRHAPERLTELTGFGSNPGDLRAHCYLPDGLAKNSALVVVLHGCTQDAASYDYGSGWSELADRHGFALLYPEQSHSNNPAACFNWFSPDDNRRDGGEAMSIHQMIGAMVERHDLHSGRIYITGLSAGAAMAVAMLASYPELFAGGAIIAGLPYGCASSVPEALKLMRGRGLPSNDELRDLVLGATAHRGPWPALSVWHGTADHVVVAGNAEALLAQWRGLHSIADAPTVEEVVSGQRRRAWSDAAGREIIEAWSIAGMGHGTPIDASPEGCGAPGPFMLDVGISSTRHIAGRWGLAPMPVGHASRVAGAAPGASASAAANPSRRPHRRSDGTPAAGKSGVGQVIEDALRAAGLMR